MRASLPQREPEILKKWLDEDLYGKLMESNEGKPLLVLHDGPPYANGDMHMGHALNKTLKDIITRYKNMSGYKAPYIHGWDTHGLPIERQAIKKLGINRDAVGVVKFRETCRDFALGYVENQKKQIQRLGSIGDWDDIYVTLDPKFEEKQIKIFGEMVKKGYIYRGLKPIYWCPDCETALAEAEIEYAEDKTDSIYVKFNVCEDNGELAKLGVDPKNVYFVIWTTTTWTLPANVAIAVNADFEYSLVKANGEIYILATELVESAMKAGGITEYETVAACKGADLEYIKCQHPFIEERKSLVITGDHVTLEAGTGCVHTAPGHGVEDYVACQRYKDIPIVVPVDSKGYMNELAGEFAGLFYADSNPKILERLKKDNMLFAIDPIIHQYPHCWRCHEPIVFRATEQWFASVEDIKEEAVKAIEGVRWIPAWGEDRIKSMVLDRNDWCISRQRTWGVPIPIFYCEECGEPLATEESINSVAKLFGEKGSDAWWTETPEEILPEGTKCKCGCAKFRKETDIMDVWFDSGSSHSGVLDVKKSLQFPADIYLEGNDQHRGWFQSSLLTSIAARGCAPYKIVITHGMIVDKERQKMSKSKGNGISPADIISRYGADILRLWVVSADYKTDMTISEEILKQLSEAYRKIRNTARFILGNIADFDPQTDMVDYGEMQEIDKWALIRLNKVVEKVVSAYEDYEFHMIYHNLHNFCVVDMSNIYLDIIKDRLYTTAAGSKERRSAQSAMYIVLDSLVRMIAPVLCYTADEIWSYMPHTADAKAFSAVMNDMAKPNDKYHDDAIEAKWDKLLSVRENVLKALEEARAEKKIGKSLEAKVVIEADADYDFLKSVEDELAEVFIVSKAEVVKGEDKVSVYPAEGAKCERCWTVSETVGKIELHPTICAKCAKNMGIAVD